jgi:arylsulfatase A
MPAPAGVEPDGRDLTAVLTRGAASPHDELMLFDNEDVMAVRTQRWKYVAATYYHGVLAQISVRKQGLTDSLQLYDMAHEFAEEYSAASHHPEVVKDMQARLQRARDRFAPLRTHAAVASPAASLPATSGSPPRQDWVMRSSDQTRCRCSISLTLVARTPVERADQSMVLPPSAPIV